MIVSIKEIKKNNTFLILCITFILIIFPNILSAQGNLLITPKRIVFDGAKRSKDLYLVNTGIDTVTYLVSFLQLKMNEDGSIAPLPESDSTQKIASNHIRYFPRSVTLGPKESQAVKLQLVKYNELETGEYRSHIYFRPEISNKPLGSLDKKVDSGVTIQLTPIYGITLPVIVRLGNDTTTVNISKISIDLSKVGVSNLTISINRVGNMSTYGDIIVNYVSNNGITTTVGVINGIAVYTPNMKRNIQIKLNNLPEVDYKTGKLKISYTDNTAKAKILAESELVL